jgi:hypothetical protein
MNGALAMKLPCEVAVKSVVPAIRALLAKELTETHGLKQKEAADLLGVTQTAVSKYAHEVRGRVLLIEDDEEVRTRIIEIAVSLVEGNLDRPTLAMQMCDTCRFVRAKGLMCYLCKREDATLNIGECELCRYSSIARVDKFREMH